MQRLLPPVLTVLCMLLMALLHAAVPVVTLVPEPLNWFGVVFVALGLWLGLINLRRFLRLGTEIFTFKEPGQLVTDGLFAISRNPIYLGMLAMLLGGSVLLGSLSAFVPTILFFVITDRWYIAFEERMLLAKFGDVYRAYQTRVRRWL